MIDAPEDRSAIAVAIAWASRISAVSLEMVIPGLIGYWLDSKLGTKAVFTIGGFGLGMVVGMFQLVRLTKVSGRRRDGGDESGRLDGS